MTGLVVGTAGHIDHGKTSLVYALTGIDTDRLKEEKQRGISINLGFAQMTLPDGRTISFVDVPGHERFVRNMLAGVAGMEAVLLIVAATEGVMPQTREHFEICRLLGLQHGMVVLTKADIATPEQMARAHSDVRKLVAGTFLETAPVMEVSAVTRAGLPELTEELARITAHASERDPVAILRMPIDRSFTLKGFGTVVTGTVLAGTLDVGATLEILPQKVRVRVRGLQSQHTAVQRAVAGQRVAVNIVGIEHTAVTRGQVLTVPDVLGVSRMLDVELRWLDQDGPSAREQYTLHLGTAETGVKITRLTADLARLRTVTELPVLPGDRFVIRRPSPAETVGGGVVVDAFSLSRLGRLKTVARLERLERLRVADVRQRLELLINEAPKGSTREQLTRWTGRVPAFLTTNVWVEARRKELLTWLREFHSKNPNAAGALLSAARLGLDPTLAASVMQGFPEIRLQAEIVALATHHAETSPGDTAVLVALEQLFLVAGLQPPSLVDALRSTGLEAKKARGLLESLVKNGRLVRLGDDLIFHATAITQVKESLLKQKQKRFSVVDFKGWTGISRKFAIPLLEYLDRQRITKREGDERIVL